MTNLPPPAAGLVGTGRAPAEEARLTPAETEVPAAAPTRSGDRAHTGSRYKPPSIRPSRASIELILDLRESAPERFVGRLFGALERISSDVTLVVQFRDAPEFAGAVAAAHHALRQHGYTMDMVRFPPGQQRLRISQRNVQRRRNESGVDRERLAGVVPEAPIPYRPRQEDEEADEAFDQ